jgi:hypothetical protein
VVFPITRPTQARLGGNLRCWNRSWKVLTSSAGHRRWVSELISGIEKTNSSVSGASARRNFGFLSLQGGRMGLCPALGLKSVELLPRLLESSLQALSVELARRIIGNPGLGSGSDAGVRPTCVRSVPFRREPIFPIIGRPFA